jgi:hypothetical protein
MFSERNGDTKKTQRIARNYVVYDTASSGPCIVSHLQIIHHHTLAALLPRRTRST